MGGIVLYRARRNSVGGPAYGRAMSVDLDFLAHLRAESTRFRDVLAATDPAARVPTCPDWNATDLLYHLGEVQRFWGTIVADRLPDPETIEDPERAPDHEAQLVLFDGYSAALVDALATTDDDVAVWTWFDADQSVGFVRRRQAHEALIHRLDAELTAGTVTDIDPALATDGALEALEWMYGSAPGWSEKTWDGPLGRLATTDTGAEWWVQLGHWSGHSPNTGTNYDTEPVLRLAEPGQATFTVLGSARDLDCWLWNRPTLDEVSVEGEPEAFLALVRDGIQ